MAKTVFTGWRNVTPGKCVLCGFDDGWHDDNAGHVTCDCQDEGEEQEVTPDP